MQVSCHMILGRFTYFCLYLSSYLSVLEWIFDDTDYPIFWLLWRAWLASDIVVFFIRRLHNTLINILRNLHEFNHVDRFKINSFTIKTLHIHLLTTTIWHGAQNYFVQLHLTNIITYLWSKKGIQIIIRIN